MAFVPRYAHDVFVSYAHSDDEAVAGSEHGWVTTLVRELEKQLNKRLGRRDAYDLWKDESLSSHEGVTPQIMDAIRDTATLVLVLSPSYLESKWCKREKDAFLQHIRGKERPGSRVFVVECDDLDRQRRPEELRDLKGYRFWVKDQHSGTSAILCETGFSKSSSDDVNQYLGQVRKLAADLEKEMRRLKPAESGVPQPVSRAPCVFVAEATEDLFQERENLIAHLDQHKVRALPERPYPWDAEAFRDAMVTDLASCKLFVQLLSGLRGRKLPGQQHGYPRFQYEIARGAGKEILQWCHQATLGSGVEDEEQRELLRGQTVQAEGMEVFKRELLRRVAEEPKKEGGGKSGGRDLRAFLFVDSEANDMDLAVAIRDDLRAFGVGVSLPVWEGDPEAVRADLEENLTLCDALIVVYGKSTVTWVRKQLFLYMKVLAERQRPPRAVAVYQGPPQDKPDLNIDMGNLRMLDCSHADRNDITARLREFIGQVGH